MQAYFHSKLVAFLGEHIFVFALNTLSILYFKTYVNYISSFFFSKNEPIISWTNLPATNSKKSVHIVHKNFFPQNFVVQSLGCILYMSMCNTQMIMVLLMNMFFQKKYIEYLKWFINSFLSYLSTNQLDIVTALSEIKLALKLI